MHVLVVHFPIALLFVAPLFVLIGALTGARSMMVSALILMVLGVAGAFVATWTGEKAMEVMGQDGDFMIDDSEMYDLAYVVLERHEEQAEYARNWFTGLTVLYLGLVLLTSASEGAAAALPRVLLGLVFLGLWSYPVVQLANAAHEGGRIVHQFGLRSVLAETVDDTEEEAADEEAAAQPDDAEAVEDDEPAAEVATEENSGEPSPSDEETGDPPAADPSAAPGGADAPGDAPPVGEAPPVPAGTGTP